MTNLQLSLVIVVFLIAIMWPLLWLVIYTLITHKPMKLGVRFVFCVIIYYVLFFTFVPDVTRPYVASHTHMVEVCTLKQVWKD